MAAKAQQKAVKPITKNTPKPQNPPSKKKASKEVAKAVKGRR